MTRRAMWVLGIGAIAITVAAGGLAIGAYSRWAAFDELTHVLSTFAAACGVALALGARVPARLERRVAVFLAIGIAIGLGWEMIEATLEWTADVDIRNRPHDTATDLVCDAAGALAAALVWPWMGRRGARADRDEARSAPHARRPTS